MQEAILVPGAGLEPARLLRTQDFESSASTNSATRALWDAKVVKKYLYLQIMDRTFETIRIETGTKITDVIPLLKDYKDVFVVYDKAVEAFAKQLKPKAFLPLRGGESIKTLATVEKIARWLMDCEAGRDAFLLIIGGGTVSDVSALAASVYKRGIRFGIVPTTLLAQVDAAIGGKTAVNLDGVKNVLGTFSLPEFTFICHEPLATLPKKEFLNGATELLKTLIISGQGYEDAVAHLKAGVCPEGLVTASARFKASIVEKDPYDLKERRVLNLGHTYGHAIEAVTASEGKALPHGEAVAIGIIMAAQLAEKIGKAEKGFAAKLEADFKAIGLPTECPAASAQLENYIRQDKKAEGGSVRMVLPIGIGQTEEYDLCIAHK